MAKLIDYESGAGIGTIAPCLQTAVVASSEPTVIAAVASELAGICRVEAVADIDWLDARLHRGGVGIVLIDSTLDGFHSPSDLKRLSQSHQGRVNFLVLGRRQSAEDVRGAAEAGASGYIGYPFRSGLVRSEFDRVGHSSRLH